MSEQIGAVVGYPDEMVATVVSALAFDAFGDAYTDTQRVLDALSSAGYLVPEGWRRDTEWAVEEGGHWTSEPFYRPEHAQRQRKPGQRVVTRRLIAEPWRPVDGDQG